MLIIRIKVTFSYPNQSTTLAFLAHGFWCHIFHSGVFSAPDSTLNVLSEMFFDTLRHVQAPSANQRNVCALYALHKS